jgi:hypothetical protein
MTDTHDATGLREVLERATDRIERPPLASRAIAGARQRHRRHRTVTVLVVVALVAAGAVAGIALGAQRDDGATAPADENPTRVIPSEPPKLAVSDWQRRPGAWDSLPWRDTTLPRVLPTAVAAAPPLSDDPVDHALALLAGPGASVGVVGDDGRLRRLDGVDLQKTDSPEGYRNHPLGKGALTPDGTLAAFPQVGAVVVVDLTTGNSQTYDVPGFNNEVLWHPDKRQILVRRGVSSSLLDTADRSVEDVPYGAFNVTFAPDGTVLELRGDSLPPDELVRWDDGTADAMPISIGIGGTGPSATDRHLVVTGSTANVPPDSNLAHEYGWIVIDIDSGKPISMLVGPEPLRATLLDALHGWLDDETVLIQTQDGVLAWTPSTSAFERVTEVSGDVWSLRSISLAKEVLD